MSPIWIPVSDEASTTSDEQLARRQGLRERIGRIITIDRAGTSRQPSPQPLPMGEESNPVRSAADLDGSAVERTG